jgi:hypothetical protein
MVINVILFFVCVVSKEFLVVQKRASQVSIFEKGEGNCKGEKRGRKSTIGKCNTWATTTKKKKGMPHKKQ